nr:hypothetical protein [Tritonibacter multivorans]
MQQHPFPVRIPKPGEFSKMLAKGVKPDLRSQEKAKLFRPKTVDAFGSGEKLLRQRVVFFQLDQMGCPFFEVFAGRALKQRLIAQAGGRQLAGQDIRHFGRVQQGVGPQTTVCLSARGRARRSEQQIFQTFRDRLFGVHALLHIQQG